MENNQKSQEPVQENPIYVCQLSVIQIDDANRRYIVRLNAHFRTFEEATLKHQKGDIINIYRDEADSNKKPESYEVQYCSFNYYPTRNFVSHNVWVKQVIRENDGYLQLFDYKNELLTWEELSKIQEKERGTNV